MQSEKNGALKHFEISNAEHVNMVDKVTMMTLWHFVDNVDNIYICLQLIYMLTLLTLMIVMLTISYNSLLRQCKTILGMVGEFPKRLLTDLTSTKECTLVFS